MKRNDTWDLLQIVLGCFILAVASTVFIMPFNIVTGGVAGFAVALNPIIQVDQQIIIYFVMAITFVLGWIFLGRKFALKSLLSTICYPVFISLIHQMNLRTLNIDPILASVYGGVIGGIGIGMVFRVEGSTGGMDIPPLIIHKYTKIPLSQLVLIVDSMTILLGVYAHGLEAFLVGFISVATTSMTLGKMLMLGTHRMKSIYIISNHLDEINQEIHRQLNRGTTIIHGEGGYSRIQRNILLVVIVERQYPKLHMIVSTIDPNAFMIVHNANEVKGEGFMNLV